jgi:hypothetical protein
MGKWKTVVLAVFVVVAVAFGIFRWRAGERLDAAKQRIRDAGYPVTYGELDEYYALPASGENRAYLLQFAIDSKVLPHPTILNALPIEGNAELPHRSEPIPEDQIKTMRDFTLLNQDAIEAVFESFEYEECRFPIDMNAGPAMLLPHLAYIRSLGRILSMHSLLSVIDGNTKAATESIMGTFELADSFEKEPILISQMVRIAIYGIGFDALEQAMNRADFSANQLNSLQNRLVEVEPSRAFVNGLIGERCVWSTVESIGFNDNAFGNGGNFDLQDLWYTFVFGPSGLLDLDGVQYFEAFEDTITAAELPIEEQIAAGRVISDQFDQGAGMGSMAAILLPSIPRALEADVRNRTYLRVVIVALAAARYEVDKGEYPENADVLVPDYLDAVPLDPCGGGLIRYRRLDQGFVAYSLALNNTDDGGEESDEDQHFWREGDLTFTVEKPDSIHRGDAEVAEN